MARQRQRRVLGANQLVAHNLRRARQTRQLTLKQAGGLLEPLTGRKWSVASLSAAEGAARNGARGREFTADEILAFSRAFGQPVAYFFTPQEEQIDPVSCGGPTLIELAELLDAVSGIDAQRIRALVETLPANERPALERFIRESALARMGAPAVRNVTTHAANLHRLANALESADDRVQAVFADELDKVLRKDEEE